MNASVERPLRKRVDGTIETKEISFLSFLIFPNFQWTITPIVVLRVIGGIQSGCWTANKEANFSYCPDPGIKEWST